METGLYYYRARYYDRAIGRFITEDPVHYGGNDNDFYRYVGNEPTGYTDPTGLVAIDPHFDKDCLRNLQRALILLAAFSTPKCNRCFSRIGDHRSLTQLLDDDKIVIHSLPKDALTNDGRPEWAHTWPGDKFNVFIRPRTCRMGRWQLARALVHELTHISLTPGVGQEGQAEQMEMNCGYRLSVSTQWITVTP